MTEQGGIYVLRITPGRRLTLAARMKLESGGNMDLSRVKAGEYLVPSYNDSVSAITVQLIN